MKNSLLYAIIGACSMICSSELLAQDITLPSGMKIISSCPTTEVKSQDRTGTCWSFSTTSFFESEIIRKNGQPLDISEMFAVRKIYVEKAEKYLRYQGGAQFSQGSLAHDVFHVNEKYGMMPESAYSGKIKDSIHNHKLLVKELKSFLDSLIKSGYIDPHWKMSFETILDSHLGELPAVFSFNDTNYNPVSFAQTVVDIKSSDYVGLTSFTHHRFNQFMIVEVPDNFSGGLYFNLPIDELMESMNNALNMGYTIEWDGDVSELGFLARKGIAVYNFDTSILKNAPLLAKENSTSQSIRQASFDSYKTTDDHLMHITGLVKDANGRLFYLVKNSWGNQAGFEGYMLMSEAYMRMKTVSIYVNKKSLSEDLLKRITSQNN